MFGADVVVADRTLQERARDVIAVAVSAEASVFGTQFVITVDWVHGVFRTESAITDETPFDVVSTDVRSTTVALRRVGLAVMGATRLAGHEPIVVEEVTAGTARSAAQRAHRRP
jgi:hypothetical protein